MFKLYRSWTNIFNNIDNIIIMFNNIRCELTCKNNLLKTCFLKM